MFASSSEVAGQVAAPLERGGGAADARLRQVTEAKDTEVLVLREQLEVVPIYHFLPNRELFLTQYTSAVIRARRGELLDLILRSGDQGMSF